MNKKSCDSSQINKKLRKGYTTGACAAAAAKGALLALILQKNPQKIVLTLPEGQKADFFVNRCEITKAGSYFSVTKDSGDDPDVTNGAEIGVQIELLEPAGMKIRGEDEKLLIKGGEGVGMVTKPGLPVPVGESAINPVPRKMILNALNEVLNIYPDFTKGSFIQASVIVPKGRILAKKTMNGRLGIIDGISILGTTGIVEPMSLLAYRATIDSQLNILIASGYSDVFFTPGRNSEKQAERLFNYPEEMFVIIGDHAEYALKAAVNKGIQCITVIGRIGKLSKMANGKFSTHVKDAYIDFKKMAGWAKELGYKEEICNEIIQANTMSYVVDLFNSMEDKRIFSFITKKVVQEISSYICKKADVRCLLLNSSGEILADER